MASSVLITGASSGIGRAAATALHERGWRVFGTSRKPRTKADDDPVEAWVEMDVRDDVSVRTGVDRVREQTPAIDALVCSAGYGIFGAVEEVPMKTAHEQLETNYFGVLRPIQAVLPSMRAARAGRIAIVGSLAGRAPNPFQSHYSSSKAAVDALALALANEMRSFGVHVSLVEPGDICTPFNEAMDWSEAGDETKRAESPYADSLRACEEVVREALPKAPGPEIVARVIVRALTARRPRVRYPVGPDSWMVPIGRRLLPDWITLRLIRNHFRLP